MAYSSLKLAIFISAAAAMVAAGTAYDGQFRYFACNEKAEKIPSCDGDYVSDIKEGLDKVTACTKPGGWEGSCKAKVPDDDSARVFTHGQCRGNSDDDGVNLRLPVVMAVENECKSCLKAAAGYLVSNCNYTEADVVYDLCSMSYSYRDL
ncbi:hypothetical protein LINPERPRIM_LOCUS14034 [Linum perenne]